MFFIFLFIAFSDVEYCAMFFLFFLNRRTAPIHAEAPEFIEMSVEQEILVTGIKVVDLLAPYAKGGKIGMWLSQGYWF